MIKKNKKNHNTCTLYKVSLYKDRIKGTVRGQIRSSMHGYQWTLDRSEFVLERRQMFNFLKDIEFLKGVQRSTLPVTQIYLVTSYPNSKESKVHRSYLKS